MWGRRISVGVTQIGMWGPPILGMAGATVQKWQKPRAFRNLGGAAIIRGRAPLDVGYCNTLNVACAVSSFLSIPACYTTYLRLCKTLERDDMRY